MNCHRAPDTSSKASRSGIGVTELALLVAHERDCQGCREERESARVSVATPVPLTPSRVLRRYSGQTIGAARAGATRVIAAFTRSRAALSTSRSTVMSSAGLASTRTIEAFRLGSTWLKLSARPLAHVPEAAMKAARSTILLARGPLATLPDLGRKAGGTVIGAARHVSERSARLLAHARSSLTPETGFLLRVCAGIAGLGILAMTLIFAWPRQWPDKTTIRPPTARSPAADSQWPSELAPAPPSVPRPAAPPERQEARKTIRPPAPTPPPESAAPARRPAEVARERAAPEAPDPSAAIDWLLKGAGGTARRDIDRQ